MRSRGWGTSKRSLSGPPSASRARRSRSPSTSLLSGCSPTDGVILTVTGHLESTTLPLMSDRRRELEDLQRQQVEADLDILRGLQRRAQLARRIGELGPQGGPPDMREQLAQLIRLAGDELSAEI